MADSVTRGKNPKSHSSEGVRIRNMGNRGNIRSERKMARNISYVTSTIYELSGASRYGRWNALEGLTVLPGVGWFGCDGAKTGILGSFMGDSGANPPFCLSSMSPIRVAVFYQRHRPSPSSYCFSLRYRVVLPMPKRRAAASLSPPASRMARITARRSISSSGTSSPLWGSRSEFL